MRAEIEIKSLVEKIGAKIDGEIVSPIGEDDSYFVSIDLSYIPLKDIRDQPHIERKIEKTLQNLNKSINIAFRNTPSQRLEENIRSVLSSAFPDFFRDVSVSAVDGASDIWISTYSHVNPSLEKIVSSFTVRFVSLISNLKCNVYFDSGVKELTKSEVLSALRLMSPAVCADLIAELTRRGFEISSPEWIVRKLDAYRKDGLVVRTKSGRYTLTLDALHKLGTVKNARSPDIARLLALTRRSS